MGRFFKSFFMDGSKVLVVALILFIMDLIAGSILLISIPVFDLQANAVEMMRTAVFYLSLIFAIVMICRHRKRHEKYLYIIIAGVINILSLAIPSIVGSLTGMFEQALTVANLAPGVITIGGGILNLRAYRHVMDAPSG